MKQNLKLYCNRTIWSIILLYFSICCNGLKNTEWKVCNQKLIQNGKTFFIRGVNYSPVPIGQSSGQDFLLKKHIYERDLAILRNMNANALKVNNYIIYFKHKNKEVSK